MLPGSSTRYWLQLVLPLVDLPPKKLLQILPYRLAGAVTHRILGALGCPRYEMISPASELSIRVNKKMRAGRVPFIT